MKRYSMGVLHSGFRTCAGHSATHPAMFILAIHTVMPVLQAGGGHGMAPRAQGGGGQVGPHAVVRVQDVPGLAAEAVGLGRPLAHLALQPGPVHGEAAAAGAALTP